MKAIEKFLLAVAVVCTPMAAFATTPELELPTSVDLSALFPYAMGIVTALVGLIVIRKAIKLTNRS